MASKRNKCLSLEELTEKQQSILQSRLPQGYLLGQYIEDVASLHTQIDGLIDDGKGYIKRKQYDIAGTTFSDVADLEDVYDALVQGQLPQALHMVEGLDTAVRDYLPVRLYDQLYRV